MTEKEKKQARSRILEINNELGKLVTTLESEKRSMTKEEKEQKEALVQEKEVLQLRLERSTTGLAPTEQEATNERSFGEIIYSLHNNGQEVAEEYRSMVEGRSITIPQNRNIQDANSTTALAPLTIGDIIEPLEKGLILDKVGVKMQHNMEGVWQFPIVAGVEATMEEENVEINDSKVDITKISPSPKRVAIAIPVSNRAITHSGGAILEIVKKQIPLAVSRLLNKWMFSRTKIVSSASNGCFVQPGSTLEFSDNPWKDAIALKGAVMKSGVVFDGTPAYICSATKYAELETTPRDAGSGLMVIQDGKINGFPVFVTEYIGEDVLGFGVFSYQMVGQFGNANLTYDPYTGAKKNLVYFVFNADFDMLTLRSEAFGILKKKED